MGVQAVAESVAAAAQNNQSSFAFHRMDDADTTKAHIDFVELFARCITIAETGEVMSDSNPWGDECGDLLPGRLMDEYAKLVNEKTPEYPLGDNTEWQRHIDWLHEVVPSSLKVAMMMTGTKPKTERVCQFFFMFIDAMLDDDNDEDQDCHEDEGQHGDEDEDQVDDEDIEMHALFLEGLQESLDEALHAVDGEGLDTSEIE